MKRSAGRVNSVVGGISSILLALVLQACESPDDPEPTLQVEDLSGTVTGTVLDSDGDPIAAATVSYTGNTSDGDIMQVSATTNAQGQFALPGIVVTGTQTAVDGAVSSDQPLTLFVQPPAGYLSATVGVSPAAQPLTSVGSEQTVFLDEFNADTGPIKLPALATTIRGVLRDTATGTPVTEASVSAEFVAIAFEQSNTTGIALSYGSATIEGTFSDAGDGSFSLPGVVDDACVRLFIGGHQIDSVSGSAPPCLIAEVEDDPKALELKTNQPTIDLANIFVSPFETTDTVAPFVAEVVGVIDPSQDPGALDSSVTGLDGQGIQIVFSEPMQGGVDEMDVVLLVGVAPDVVAVQPSSVSLTGADTLVIETAEPLPAGTPITVQIAGGLLKDLAGNKLALSATVAYDAFTGSSNQYFELDLLSFEPSNTVADAALPAQVKAPFDDGDTAFVTTSALVDSVGLGSETINSAMGPGGTAVQYASATGGDSDDVEQLNASSAEEALQALLNALEGDGSRELFTDIARVRVQSSANAADYLVSVERSGTPLDVLVFPVATVDGNPQNTGPVPSGSFRYRIDPNGASSFDLLLLGRTAATVLRDGDTFRIVSRNANGVLGGSATLGLTDIAPPTVGVQLLTEVIAATAGNGGQGGGGGVIIEGSDPEPGVVIYPITPQATDVDDTEAGFGEDDLAGERELLGLSDAALGMSSYAAALGDTQTLADATGTTAFIVDTGPRLGIVISEPSGVVAGATPTLTDISATLSSFGVLNGATTEDGEPVILFAYNVDAVFKLEADGRASDEATIDLTGVIRDANGLVADAGARARVRVRDYFPPLMTLAFYDGTNLVFQFHEPVQKSGTLFLENCAYAIDVADVSVAQSADGTTFTVPASMLTDDAVDPASCFDPTLAYSEEAYSLPALGELTALTAVASVPPHGLVSYDTIMDGTDNLGTGVGNSWAGWAANGLGMGTPYFAGANIIPPP